MQQPSITPFRIALAQVLGTALFAVTLLLPAGRIDWVRGWLYVVLVAITLVVDQVYLDRVNPGLIERRMRWGRGTKTWDKVWAAVFAPLFLGMLVLAALDAVRYQWSSMSGWLWPIGLALFVPGSLLFSWSMGVNPFFEKTVRIQTELGHHVIDSGPYQRIRHPGYAGFCAWILATPLLLGSWWALIPAALSILSLLARTALEDLTLRRELEGYQEYSDRVRFRLIPGIW